jgi:hypothetical protein
LPIAFITASATKVARPEDAPPLQKQAFASRTFNGKVVHNDTDDFVGNVAHHVLFVNEHREFSAL